ncbi:MULTISPECIES: sigma-70 family RNA polymerase sigma factor [Micrococcaceae]|uniref:RNA polymerase sigma factor n=1 Tax=Micrococcaceae TaxID=1268 RepID=UPI0010363D79|nr:MULTISPECIES: sigma-70 family RNA polymerase sigma factor [Micrococcaceae]TAP25181.1 sigma-70 family RNA polymerase sigma factor [Arthrobacter sp. S41]UXN32161.1 sigma-70 family RNA polymerase sigma factor [Glutamicibacter sp. M10]
MQVPFERIVQDYGLNVLRVCRALLDEHRAQDAWSETFLSALSAYPKLPEEANVLAWLVRIARNKAIDELRKNKPEILDDLQSWEQVDDGQQSEAQLENLVLWQEVGRLPHKQRLVVAYRYLGGLNYAQIADILSGTEAAARRAGADGIKNLRRMLEDDTLWQEQS